MNDVAVTYPTKIFDGKRSFYTPPLERRRYFAHPTETNISVGFEKKANLFKGEKIENTLRINVTYINKKYDYLGGKSSSYEDVTGDSPYSHYSPIYEQYLEIIKLSCSI